MDIVILDIFGVLVDVPFPSPLGFAQAKLEEFGAKLCDTATGLSLRPDQIRVKRWDELYGYELSAQFFGENGTLTRTADRIKLGIRNARTAGDWKIIHDTLMRFYTLMDFPAESVTTLSAHAHARFPTAEERDAFLQRFSYSPLFSKAAALGYVQVIDWEREIRVLIEQSNVVSEALFVMWDTQFTNDQEWDPFLSTLPTLMDNAANLFDLGFEPMRERV
ncbi:MAG: hypothetical protein QOE70_1452 [Chthoniobacter sp.]|jgi:hypothetical protein|nr:hypothetical protein [Chthoniobacter sp.]